MHICVTRPQWVKAPVKSEEDAQVLPYRFSYIQWSNSHIYIFGTGFFVWFVWRSILCLLTKHARKDSNLTVFENKCNNRMQWINYSNTAETSHLAEQEAHKCFWNPPRIYVWEIRASPEGFCCQNAWGFSWIGNSRPKAGDGLIVRTCPKTLQQQNWYTGFNIDHNKAKLHKVMLCSLSLFRSLSLSPSLSLLRSRSLAHSFYLSLSIYMYIYTHW